MQKISALLSDSNSVVLAIGIIVFFGYFPGYEPATTNSMLLGLGVVVVIAFVYGVIEYLTVVRAETVSPLYFAWETEISHLPVYAFVVVGTWWLGGDIIISPFQWLVAVILTVSIVLDIVGFVSLLAQRYLLTDELKTVR